MAKTLLLPLGGEGGEFDPTQYYTKSDIDIMLTDKQDALIAGDNVTIDSDNVISANVPSGYEFIKLEQGTFEEEIDFTIPAWYYIDGADFSEIVVVCPLADETTKYYYYAILPDDLIEQEPTQGEEIMVYFTRDGVVNNTNVNYCMVTNYTPYDIPIWTSGSAYHSNWPTEIPVLTTQCSRECSFVQDMSTSFDGVESGLGFGMVSGDYMI